MKPGEKFYKPDLDSSGNLKNVDQFNPPVWVKLRGSLADESPYLEPLDQTHEINCISSSDWKINENLPVNR